MTLAPPPLAQAVSGKENLVGEGAGLAELRVLPRPMANVAQRPIQGKRGERKLVVGIISSRRVA